jgi:hypothetical protein
MIDIIAAIRRIDELSLSDNFENAIMEAQNIRATFENKLRDTLINCGLRVPNLLLGGPARTATTWLRGALGKHPSINVARGEPNIIHNISQGALHFTLSRYAQPDLWRKDIKNLSAYCDKSPSYICLSDKDIALLGALFPDIKIIFGIRNENHRLWSVINHRMNDFSFTGNWIDFCVKNTNEIAYHINAGNVQSHVDRWSSVFDKSNILLLDFTDIRKSPSKCIEQVLNHIGVQQVVTLLPHEQSGIKRRINFKEDRRNITDPPDDLMLILNDILQKSNDTDSPT